MARNAVVYCAYDAALWFPASGAAVGRSILPASLKLRLPVLDRPAAVAALQY
jgi:hypothetical protein